MTWEDKLVSCDIVWYVVGRRRCMARESKEVEKLGICCEVKHIHARHSNCREKRFPSLQILLLRCFPINKSNWKYHLSRSGTIPRNQHTSHPEPRNCNPGLIEPICRFQKTPIKVLSPEFNTPSAVNTAALTRVQPFGTSVTAAQPASGGLFAGVFPCVPLTLRQLVEH